MGNDRSRWHSAKPRLLVVGCIIAWSGFGLSHVFADKLQQRSPLRGVVRALDQAAISTELAVRVTALHVREGDTFQAGATLIEFDCRRQEATVAAAEAQELEMQLAVDKNRMLLKTQAVGKNDLEVSEARLGKAKAEAKALRSQLSQCLVIAPFDGRVMDIAIQVHETTQPGKPFIGLVATARLEIDLIVPSTWIRSLGPGKSFEFKVDELDTVFQANIVRLGAAVDPVSQTIKVIGAFNSEALRVLPGMSGTAVLLDHGTRSP